MGCLAGISIVSVAAAYRLWGDHQTAAWLAVGAAVVQFWGFGIAANFERTGDVPPPWIVVADVGAFLLGIGLLVYSFIV